MLFAQPHALAWPYLTPAVALGKLGHFPGHSALYSGCQVHCGKGPPSPPLIAIQSRQSSPQDPNAIFSLSYAKSFREGCEII